MADKQLSIEFVKNVSSVIRYGDLNINQKINIRANSQGFSANYFRNKMIYSFRDCFNQLTKQYQEHYGKNYGNPEYGKQKYRRKLAAIKDQLFIF